MNVKYSQPHPSHFHSKETRALHESPNCYPHYFDFQMKMVCNRYLLKHRIGQGSFGEIFAALDICTNQTVAIKFQLDAKRTFFEYQLMELAFSSKNPSSPKPIAYFSEPPFYVIVMQLLGPSLDELFVYCNCKFSLPTILRIAYSALFCCERIHNSGVIHRDIQPKNLVMGTKDLTNKLYVIDFGLAEKWRIKLCENYVHIPYHENENFTGTLQYSSLNAHLGIHQTRRDDLESLGFVLMYFNRGSLPWQGIRHCNKKQKNERICEMKMSVCVQRLCQGYPDEFFLFLKYCRSLSYKETPNYAYLRYLFHRLWNNKFNFTYDWISRYREIENTSSHANNKYQPHHFEISNWINEYHQLRYRKTYV